ncbi:metalloregulator ArsR/SmtB family transcription factor [Nocardioides sp. L-11A]|uniref:ArsR/SmtB family transcription factor n=1 Tax=Nocardioides sp. L-11A TaxID=3043848 RepID=UPI00249CE38A|nr:metalloregulator ArsR/SmtB family transcription factor [Nocardioides sp. L-11A]
MHEYDEQASPLPAAEQVELAVEVFRMLADPTRVRLLWLLRAGEAPVLRLAEEVGKPQTAVSQHLAKLRLARLVTTRRQGAQVFYALTNEHVSQLVVDGVRHAEHLGPGVPAHHASAGAEAGR